MKEAEDKALKKLEESKKKEDQKASGSKDKPKKKDKNHDAEYQSNKINLAILAA